MTTFQRFTIPLHASGRYSVRPSGHDEHPPPLAPAPGRTLPRTGRDSCPCLGPVLTSGLTPGGLP